MVKNEEKIKKKTTTTTRLFMAQGLQGAGAGCCWRIPAPRDAAVLIHSSPMKSRNSGLVMYLILFLPQIPTLLTTSLIQTAEHNMTTLRVVFVLGMLFFSREFQTLIDKKNINAVCSIFSFIPVHMIRAASWVRFTLQLI